MIPTFLHRWYAALLSYGWRPCPLCGREFGGHQWKDRGGKVSHIPHPAHPPLSGHDIAICPTCTKAGRGWDDGSVIDNPGVVTYDPEGGQWS